jgi:hypothetical protein
MRTQRLANGAGCTSDGALFRHDLAYTIPPTAKTDSGSVWVGLIAVDHAKLPPNALDDNKQRRRVAQILVVERAHRRGSTWGQ